MTRRNRQTAVDRFPNSFSDWGSAWFVALEDRLDHGDIPGAAEALKELRRLGYEVKIRPQTRLCPI